MHPSPVGSLKNLGIVFPISIANLGPFEVSIAMGLGLAGVTFSTGLAIGTAYHGLQILGIALLALASIVVKRRRER
jgi:LPXTG-motif cell wall-anchored protein